MILVSAMKKWFFLLVLVLSFYALLGSILLCCLHHLPKLQPGCDLQVNHPSTDMPSAHQIRRVLQESEELEQQSNYAAVQNFRNMTTNLSKGFALLLSYPGQQSVGLRALISLQCMIGSFKLPVRVVEPFIEQSKFLAYPSSQNVPTMKDFFDIHHYNSASESQGSAELATWEEFVQSGPLAVVLVRLSSTSCSCMHGRRRSPGPAKVDWDSYNTQTCYNASVGKLGNFSLSKAGFCIVRVVNLTASPSVRLPPGQELLDLIYGHWDFRYVTVIFDKWCPGTYILNRNLSNPAQCRDVCETGLNDVFQSSPQLLQHAENYEKRHLKATEKAFKVAVMLRSERLFHSKRSNSIDRISDPQSCLKSAQELTQQLRGCETACTATMPFVTADIGRYGSGSWKIVPNDTSNSDRHVVEAVQDTVVSLLNRTMSFDAWQDGFVEASGGLQDRGYIAALQRTIASQADCLVLVGGGNFIKLALHEYLLRHPDPQSWCIRYVCVGDFSQQYDRILHDRKTAFLHSHLKELDGL